MLGDGGRPDAFVVPPGSPRGGPAELVVAPERYSPTPPTTTDGPDQDGEPTLYLAFQDEGFPGSRYLGNSTAMDKGKIHLEQSNGGFPIAQSLESPEPMSSSAIYLDSIRHKTPHPRDSGYSTSPSVGSRGGSVGSTRSTHTSPHISFRDDTPSKSTGDVSNPDAILGSKGDYPSPIPEDPMDSRSNTGSTTPREQSNVGPPDQPEELLTHSTPIRSLPRCDSPLAMAKPEFAAFRPRKAGSPVPRIGSSMADGSGPTEPPWYEWKDEVCLGHIFQEAEPEVKPGGTLPNEEFGHEDNIHQLSLAFAENMPIVERSGNEEYEEIAIVPKTKSGGLHFWARLGGFAKRAMKPFIPCLRCISVHAMPRIASIPRSSPAVGPALLLPVSDAMHPPAPAQDADSGDQRTGSGISGTQSRPSSHKRRAPDNGRDQGSDKRQSRGAAPGSSSAGGGGGDHQSDSDDDGKEPYICPVWAHDPINADPSCRYHQQPSLFRLKSGTLGRSHNINVSALPRQNTSGLSRTEAYYQLYQSIYPDDSLPISPFAKNRIDILIQRAKEQIKEQSLVEDNTNNVGRLLTGHIEALQENLKQVGSEMAKQTALCEDVAVRLESLEHRLGFMEAYWHRIDAEALRQGLGLNDIAAAAAESSFQRQSGQQEREEASQIKKPARLFSARPPSSTAQPSLPRQSPSDPSVPINNLSTFRIDRSGLPRSFSSPNIHSKAYSQCPANPEGYTRQILDPDPDPDSNKDDHDASPATPTQKKPRQRSSFLAHNPASLPASIPNSQSIYVSGPASASQSITHSLIPIQMKAEPSPPYSSFHTTPDPISSTGMNSTVTGLRMWQNHTSNIDQGESHAAQQKQQREQQRRRPYTMRTRTSMGKVGVRTGIETEIEPQEAPLRASAAASITAPWIIKNSGARMVTDTDTYRSSKAMTMDMDMDTEASSMLKLIPIDHCSYHTNDVNAYPYCGFRGCTIPCLPGYPSCARHLHATATTSTYVPSISQEQTPLPSAHANTPGGSG